MPANQVRDIFIARIKQLMAQFEGSKTIKHAPTVGAMREDYLKSFLRELLPPKFHPVSGFICDMHGNITPQLDMIFVDNSELPTISLVSDTVIVPYEIALLTAEVKSTITMETLEQIKKQRAAINGMQSQFLMASSTPNHLQPRGRRNRIGTFIIAFESNVGEGTLRQWVEREMEEPAGICVINSSGGMLSIFFSVSNRQIDSQKAKDSNDYDPLLTFVGAVYRWLYLLVLENSTMSDQEKERYWNAHAMWIWEGYLSEHLYQHLQRFQQ